MTLITVIIDLKIKNVSSKNAHAYADGIKESLKVRWKAKKKDPEIRSIQVRTIVHDNTTGEGP
jgi:hypothetical protein